jgi:hypothetical protein
MLALPARHLFWKLDIRGSPLSSTVFSHILNRHTLLHQATFACPLKAHQIFPLFAIKMGMLLDPQKIPDPIQVDRNPSQNHPQTLNLGWIETLLTPIPKP